MASWECSMYICGYMSGQESDRSDRLFDVCKDPGPQVCEDKGWVVGGNEYR